jgi:cell division protein FtsB
MLKSIPQVKDQELSARDLKGEGGLHRKAATIGSILLLIALAIGSIFGDRGYLHLMSQTRRSEALERELTGLRAENLRLAEEITGLRSSPQAVERVAREELGLARPGEIVFLLREDAQRTAR